MPTQTRRLRFAILAPVSAYLLSVLAGQAQQLGQVQLQPYPLQRDVMYRILFREIVAYQDMADQMAAQSKDAAFLRNYHQNTLELSTAMTAQLIQIVRPCVTQVRAIDAQANAVIRATKAQHKGAPPGSPNATTPPPPPELALLEAKRSAVILAAADSIAAAFGPAQFAYFETLVRRHVGSSFKSFAGSSAAQ